MEPIDIYLMYCAFKAHFGKTSYDFVKYKGKTRISRDTFFKRKDRAFFVRLSKKYQTEEEIKNYFIANFLKCPHGYVADFTDKHLEDWKKNDFLRDMKPLVNNFDDLFVVSNTHPKLLKEYLGRRISIDTLVILDELVGYIEDWNVKLKDDVVWPNIENMIKKYKSFLTIDKNKYRMNLLTLIEESRDGTS